MSTVCHEMLNVLSSNEHVAAMMARDPSLRAAVVGEITRQLSGWRPVADSDDAAAVQLSSPDQVLDATLSGDGDEGSYAPPVMRGSSHRRRTSRGIMGVERRHRPERGVAAGGKDEGAPPDAGVAAGDENGGGVGEDRGRSRGAEEIGEEGEEEEEGGVAVPEGSIVLDPFYAALCLRTLSNVMRASRGRGTSSDPAADGLNASLDQNWGMSLKLPWPVRLLYGGSEYGEGGGEGRGEEGTVEWPLEKKAVGDIAELMLCVSARGAERVGTGVCVYVCVLRG